MENKKVQCCGSEVINGQHLNQCTSFDTERDGDNHQERYFCKIHMLKVIEIRFEMFKKQAKKNGYINKYALIDYMKRDLIIMSSRLAIKFYELLLDKLEDGEFD